MVSLLGLLVIARRLNGCEPEGSEAWAEARLPEVLSFVKSLHQK